MESPTSNYNIEAYLSDISSDFALEDSTCANVNDDVAVELNAAGVAGAAAAAAIVPSKGKRPHKFETNPSTRLRQQNRLIRKLKQTVHELTTRVGQQAVVLVAAPGKKNNCYKVHGATPLKYVMTELKDLVMAKLESKLVATPPILNPTLFELPSLVGVDGIPTPIDKMTQSQLRAFIPNMLKYSTGKGKPGWGKDSAKPPWWPEHIPWANIRTDVRTQEEKTNLPWTLALRQIVIKCYLYHNREDLLIVFNDNNGITNFDNTQCESYVQHTVINPDGSINHVQLQPYNDQHPEIDENLQEQTDAVQYYEGYTSANLMNACTIKAVFNPDGGITLTQDGVTLGIVRHANQTDVTNLHQSSQECQHVQNSCSASDEDQKIPNACSIEYDHLCIWPKQNCSTSLSDDSGNCN